MRKEIAITGVGYAVPPHIRTNDDPIFDWLRKNPPPGQDLFAGYKERRVLGPEQGLIDIMLPAAQQALAMAGITPQKVDVLLMARGRRWWAGRVIDHALR